MRVLSIHIGEMKMFTDATATFVAYVTVTDPPGGGDPIDIAITEQTVGLKVLGLYRTPIQLNIQITSVVKDYLNNVYSIPTNSYDAQYLCGGDVNFVRLRDVLLPRLATDRVPQ